MRLPHRLSNDLDRRGIQHTEHLRLNVPRLTIRPDPHQIINIIPADNAHTGETTRHTIDVIPEVLVHERPRTRKMLSGQTTPRITRKRHIPDPDHLVTKHHMLRDRLSLRNMRASLRNQIINVHVSLTIPHQRVETGGGAW